MFTLHLPPLIFLVLIESIFIFEVFMFQKDLLITFLYLSEAKYTYKMTFFDIYYHFLKISLYCVIIIFNIK